MRFLVCAAAFAALVSSGAVPAKAQTPTVDEVLAKYYEARGGYEKLKAIQTLKITQTVANPFNSTRIVILKKRPGLIRWEITPAGQTTPITRAINADGGWDMQAGKVVARPDIFVRQEREFDADLDGLLVDWKDKGHRLALDGTESVRGRSGYRLKVTTKEGFERIVIIDAKTFLPLSESGRVMHPPDPRTGQARFNDHVFTYGDWREVAGVKFPFAVDEERTGGPITQSFASYVETIEVNVPIEDSVFAKSGS